MEAGTSDDDELARKLMNITYRYSKWHRERGEYYASRRAAERRAMEQPRFTKWEYWLCVLVGCELSYLAYEDKMSPLQTEDR